MASLPEFNAIMVQQGFDPYPLCLVCETIVHSDDDSDDVPELGLLCGLACTREALARMSFEESKAKCSSKGTVAEPKRRRVE